MLLVAACSGGDSVVSRDVVDQIPWPETETATYRVLNDDAKEVGTMVLTVEPGEEGETVLRQHFDFPETGFTNDAEVVVDSAELQPRSSRFQIDGPEGVLDCEATYEGSEVKVHRVGEDGARDDTLDVPSVAHDSWSDLFVWRTITFSQGFDTAYTDMLSCVLAKPQRLEIKLDVTGSEEVEVPFGTFEAWRVEIEAGRDQKAWFTTDDAHILVRYDNGEQVFELTDYEAE
ncbi:MAG: DUF3108 domain-containing protein [Dehalococcoidia bacterium]